MLCRSPKRADCCPHNPHFLPFWPCGHLRSPWLAEDGADWKDCCGSGSRSTPPLRALILSVLRSVSPSSVRHPMLPQWFPFGLTLCPPQRCQLVPFRSAPCFCSLLGAKPAQQERRAATELQKGGMEDKRCCAAEELPADFMPGWAASAGHHSSPHSKMQSSFLKQSPFDVVVFFFRSPV